MAFEQSVSWWCIAREENDPVDMLQTCKAIGYTAMELVPVDKFQVVRDQGMKIATHQLHGPIPVGINNPGNWGRHQTTVGHQSQAGAGMGHPLLDRLQRQPRAGLGRRARR